MAYTLQAVIAKTGVLKRNLPAHLGVVALNGGVEMVPLGSEAEEAYGLESLPLTKEDDGKGLALPLAAVELCKTLSQGGVVAYVEAEYFGGWGDQAHVIFENGKQVSPVVRSEGAIDAALRLLGVQRRGGRLGGAIIAALRLLGVWRGGSHDEFETVGLGQHRDTDSWLSGGGAYRGFRA